MLPTAAERKPASTRIMLHAARWQLLARHKAAVQQCTACGAQECTVLFPGRTEPGRSDRRDTPHNHFPEPTPKLRTVASSAFARQHGLQCSWYAGLRPDHEVTPAASLPPCRLQLLRSMVINASNLARHAPAAASTCQCSSHSILAIVRASVSASLMVSMRAK